MHWLDSTILAGLAAAAVIGAYSGLLMQVFRLVGLAAALYAAACLHNNTTNWLHDSLMRGADTRACDAVAYGTVFLIVYLSIFLTTVALERGMKAVRLQVVNRLLGALLGAAKLGLLLGAIFLGIRHYPSAATREMMRRSALAPLLAQGAENLVVALAAECQQNLREGLDELGNTLHNAAEAPSDLAELESP